MPIQQLSAQRPLRQLPGLKLEDGAKHVMEPAHVVDIEIEEVDERREVKPRRRRRLPDNFKFSRRPKLDVGKFGDDMHEALKDDVAGYILTVRKAGNPIYHRQLRWARGPLDGTDTWNPDIRMHVASVSKLLTAIGMVQVLDAAGLSYDTKIAPYLPEYWRLGNNIDRITFRQLLNHRSGFKTGTSKSSYGFMKARVADGVASVGGYDYENMNFGLCRILIPVLRKEIDRNQRFPISEDQLWDIATTQLFREYMQAKVFSPSGVSAVGFAPLPGMKNALAYRFPNAGSGWNSGDLSTMAGGAGFRLSLNELMAVQSALRRGKLMPKSKAQALLDGKLGIDQVIETPAGTLYNKNGGWRNNGRREQCVAYFFPDDMECAVFVNSSIGADDISLRNLVRQSFEDNLVE